VIVTDEPLAEMFATPVAGRTVHVTVRPESEFPFTSFGVAVMVVVSEGRRTAVLLLSETLFTTAGGGGFVVPPLSLLPPHAAKEQRTTAGTYRAKRMGMRLRW
jgi:hypothetical protein